MPKSLSRMVQLALLLFCATLMFPVMAPAAFDPAVDMYSEHIPGPGGDRPTGRIDPDRKGDALPPSVDRELRRSGKDGRAVVRMVALTTPTPDFREAPGREAPGREIGEGSIPPDGAVTPDDRRLKRTDAPPSALDAAGIGLTAGGGLGAVFPLVLILVTLLAGAIVVLYRWRPGRR